MVDEEARGVVAPHVARYCEQRGCVGCKWCGLVVCDREEVVGPVVRNVVWPVVAPVKVVASGFGSRVMVGA